MRTYMFFVVLISGFALAITAAYKPEAFGQIIESAKAPIVSYMDEKAEKELGEVYLQDKAAWMMRHPLPSDCYTPSTNLKAVECKNRRDLELAEFRRQWQASH